VTAPASRPADRQGGDTATHSTARPHPDVLSPTQREAIRAAILALPPMTDEQTDALCDVITTARQRWRREDTEHPPPHP